jgi:carbonic anhydrase
MTPKAQTFATCLSCIDGRVAMPVTQFIKDKHGVAFVDYITEAGMDGFIFQPGALEGILRKVDFSFKNHRSSILYIVGHTECSGNIVDDEQHKKDILAAVERLKRLRPSVAVGGLFVDKEWKASPVTPIKTLKRNRS